MERMFDLTAEALPDGTVRLTQTDCGEDYIVVLHPAQLRHIAEEFAAPKRMAAAPAQTWPPGFERRMIRLREQAADLAGLLGSIPSYPPRAGMEPDEEQAHDLWQAIDDLMDDLGIAADAKPEPEPEAAVTPEPSKPQQGALFEGAGE